MSENPTARVLVMDVVAFEDEVRWQWRLSDEAGRLVATHRVSLDRNAHEYGALVDLHRYLAQRAIPDRRGADHAALIHAAGHWIGQHVLGDVGVALQTLADTGPIVVRVRVPEVAPGLVAWPLELGHLGGRPLALHDVSVVYEMTPPSPLAVAPVTREAPLRILAVFSVPTDERALAVRRERQQIDRMVRDITRSAGVGIELETVQYGVTRERLAAMLADQDGWDVVHISSHGLRGGVVLEGTDGRHSVVGTSRLIEMLMAARGRLKLLVLSACSSAAASAQTSLRQLGVRSALADVDLKGQDDLAASRAAAVGMRPPTTMAAEVARQVGCAVLAMRYPVDDDFAMAFTGRLYRLLFAGGHPLPHAHRLALAETAAAGRRLELVTPALFGSATAGLVLRPPSTSTPPVIASELDLPGFPPLPDRFVGRVAIISRASAALAPESGHSGVLLHGMAGVGKRACALELAYTHRRAFDTYLFHQFAEGEGEGELGRLASALDGHFKDLAIAPWVGDTDRLAHALPRLTDHLEQSRTLIVLDDLELALEATGEWRDERWRLLMEALAGHGGPARIVLTSRFRPRALVGRMVIEPLHGLSLTESALLAREHPRLRALLDGTADVDVQQGRSLVLRVLNVVQGHPLLMALADQQAADAAGLERHLDAAEGVRVGDGERLGTFVELGGPGASDQDPVTVIGRWADAVLATVAPAGATAFQFLLHLEDDDRLASVARATWAASWPKLGHGGNPPDLDEVIAPLRAQGLVALDDARDPAYRIHPALSSSAAPAARAVLGEVVDRVLADFWMGALVDARAHEMEGRGPVLLRAARGVLAYSLRRREWEAVCAAVTYVLDRDRSPETIAAMLPVLHRSVEATAGGPHELQCRRELARALSLSASGPPAVELMETLHGLLDTTVERHEFGAASKVAGDLAAVAERSGRLDEASFALERKQEYTRLAGLGPWTRLADEVLRYRLLVHRTSPEDALEAVLRLQDDADALPDTSDAEELVIPWRVREDILDLGFEVAADVDTQAWVQARLDSMRRRAAGALEIATAKLDGVWPLVRLNLTAEARKILVECLAASESAHDAPLVGRALTRLAQIEDLEGRHAEAVRFGRQALRYRYAGHDPLQIASSHHDLAVYAQRAGSEPREALAHRLAGVLVTFQVEGAEFNRELRLLAHDLARFPGDPPVPGSFAELCRLVDQVEGVDLARLLSALPRRIAGGEAALREVLRLAAELSPEEVMEQEERMASILRWAVDSLVEPGIVDLPPATANELASRQDFDEWLPYVQAMGNIVAGDRSQEALGGLAPADAGVLQGMLSALSGGSSRYGDIDLPTIDQLRQSFPAGLSKGWLRLLEAIIEAPPGEEMTAIGPILGELAREGDPMVASFGATVRRLVMGHEDVSPAEIMSHLGSPEAIATGVTEDLTVVAHAAQARAADEVGAPLVQMVVAAARGDETYVAVMEQLLAQMDADSGVAGAGLARVWRRIIAGERSEDLTDGLEAIDAAMVNAVLLELDDASALRRRLERFGPAEARGRELLSALAWSEGAGLPRSLWPAVAGALAGLPGGSGLTYVEGDVDWMMEKGGDFVLVSNEDGQTFHRIADAELRRLLREQGTSPTDEVKAAIATMLHPPTRGV